MLLKYREEVDNILQTINYKGLVFKQHYNADNTRYWGAAAPIKIQGASFE
ncbi:MAG: hypothetical protein O4752_04200 [Trichodesmium sp. St4_bin8_1]|nr:hypothetical protein [Trichodesmium sp. St4_bin8_1]